MDTPTLLTMNTCPITVLNRISYIEEKNMISKKIALNEKKENLSGVFIECTRKSLV